jgi:hemolysin III
MPQTYPHYTAGERLADAVVHAVGVAASIAAAAVLLVLAFGEPPASVASLVIYAAALVAVFGFSAAYHLVDPGRLKAVLRRCDHATIYVKIAATYTPFALVKIGSATGAVLLGSVWLAAALGAALKLFWPGQLVRASYALYLAQGWAGVMALNSLAAAVSGRVLVLLAIGGALYTIGVVFHLWHKLPYHNAIWHALVLIASGVHFAAVIDALALVGSRPA